ncbi:sugar MFS transporter [Agreia sp. COWG]|uniref:MFS transporter n=1 Tax=Agreia sp. COWG TaxID=2773266 RepID=UPI001927F8C5|nr:MFS transporter [Agreia sp. COWG]
MRSSVPSYLAFAGFGIFWGTWGAALPAIRAAASLSDAQLGTALIFVGLGALPAMALVGRVIDRFGARVAGMPLIALAVAGVIVASVARDFFSVCVAMLLVGATSGAADVAANALAGLAENRSGGRVITLAHAVFSSFVVVGSLGAGLLLAVAGQVLVVFAVAGALVAASGIGVLLLGDGPHGVVAGTERRGGLKSWSLLPFVAIGVVGAFGFAAENAHQSWSAIFLTDELAASPALAALAPATFATFAAVTRFTVGHSTRVPERALLGGGAIVAVVGTLALATAHDILIALAGLALAAVGTSVLFPTLLSRGVRDVAAERRGRASSAIGTTAYLGFLLGPVYVGALSGAFGLRGAMIGVAVLVAIFGVLAPFVGRPQRA